jgi:cytoskeleton protein RodZ
MSAEDNNTVQTEASAHDSTQAASQEDKLYGKSLQHARKQHSYSVEDVADAIHVSPEIIEALESSATEGLPPATFVQGYLRAYARYVDVSVEKVLHDYAVAVPHMGESELHARSRLPKEASSQQPLVKALTRLLLVFGIVAVLYAIYSYYTDKMNDFADSNESRGRIEVQQNARLTDSGELIVGDNTTESAPASQQPEYTSLAESLQPVKERAVVEIEPAQEEVVAVVEPPPAPMLPIDDEIMLYADKDSWVEITDAADRNLFYNLLKEGEERELEGSAPFDVFIGNAPAITLRVNDVDIDMTRFIRSNNIAQFRVSTNDDRAVFH